MTRPDPTGSGTERVRYSTSTAFDRVLATSRIVAAIGPIADLDTDRIRTRLTSGWTPLSRLTVIPHPERRRWAHDMSRSPVVTEHPELADLNVGDMVTAIQNRRHSEPLRVLVCGRWLVVDYSHGVGDGVLGVTLLTQLTYPDELADLTVFEHQLPPAAAWLGLWRVLRENPRRMREIRALRAAVAHPPTPSADREIDDWPSKLRTMTAVMPAEQVAAVSENLAMRGISASSATVSVALWHAAVARERCAVDERVMMLFNCRRYLGPRYAAAQGNFAVAVPVRVSGHTSPSEIFQQVRAIVRSGWPAVILGTSEIRGLLRRRRDSATGATAMVPERVRLSISDLGAPPAMVDVDWAPGAQAKILTSYLDPDGPDAISTLVSECDGTRVFSASFCEDFVSADFVRAALDRLITDPVALLADSVPDR